MLFNSFSFLLLVSITFFFYYLPPFKRTQRFVLILTSFVFYAANQPVLLLLLVGSIFINMLTSYLVFYGAERLRKTYAVLGVVLNLSILAFFKYSPLIGKSFFNEVEGVGEFLIAIPLPIGISFYTFQGITLLVDLFQQGNKTYEHNYTPPKSFLDHSANVALYISFFPQLVAGPIVKAHTFLPQIKAKSLNEVDWEFCFKALVLGYFLKMFVADNLKDHTFWLAYPHFQNIGTSSLLMMLFGYSMQIFADFAGYSLIAIGVAGLFGYRLPENFNFPYISESFSEFWTRWHISLSSFLKEYLYFPLGGNRKSRQRTYVNLFIVMLLGGLWHGAAWSFAVWGAFHGIALAMERGLRGIIKLPEIFLIKVIKVCFVFIFVTFAWLLFKLPDFSYVVAFVEALFTNVDKGAWANINQYIPLYSAPVIIYHLYYLAKNRLRVFHVKIIEPFVYSCMLFLIITNSGSANEFIYFQF